MEPKKIVIEPSADHPDVLHIKDAMQQVIDYFDLLTDQSQSNVVWNLERASTDSPFTAVGAPIDRRTDAKAYGLVANHVSRIERGLVRLEAGEPLDDDFPVERREIAVKMLKRNMNGIGRTKITIGGGVEVRIDPINAKRSLDVISGASDETYDFLFSSFARKEIGSLEGRIVELSTDYEEPAVKLREHRTGRDIQCRISAEARNEIEDSLTAGDVWKHRRVRVRGGISYDPGGRILRMYDGRVSYVDPEEVTVGELRDEDFTAGLPAHEYIDRLRENEFG